MHYGMVLWQVDGGIPCYSLGRYKHYDVMHYEIVYCILQYSLTYELSSGLKKV